VKNLGAGTLPDGIEPSVMGYVIEKNLKIADEAGILEGYRVLEGGIGVYFSSARKVPKC
jgi:hypothetical protein